ncbi:MAG: aminotransferase class I/II-fold pyridoxal phosphate-dependent enzyme [Saprospirales bacterium]|nr:MAG: aminotransferase class I/II-fold pyridoxal phosphate-dependent enzyme [Saprospirales bacterium]
MSKKYATICARELFVDQQFGSHQLPIYQSSSFYAPSMEEAIEVFKGEKKGFIYTRYGNPTIEAVQDKLALLEGLESSEEKSALLTTSGMAAISTLVQSILEKGQAVLIHPSLYGGTLEYFFSELKRAGHPIITADFRNLDTLESKVNSHLRELGLIYYETPTNPGLELIDIRAVSKIAKSAGIPTIVDNTFCTSYLQRPLDLGADFVIYSTTKFINGHGNSIGGAIVGNDSEFMRNRVWKSLKLIGGTISPFEAWLIAQGMKTLTLRMDQQCRNAQKLAEYLNSRTDVVRKVNYPGLSSHPQNHLATRQMSQPGSMLSFVLNSDLEGTVRFCNALEYSKAPTLGDTDTLLLHPATSSHINVDRQIRESTGIEDSLIRISTGIEDIGDLIAELESAFLY